MNRDKRLATCPLTFDERDRRWANIRKEMAKQNLDCLIVFGVEGHFFQMLCNLRYLTNYPMGKFLVFPKDGEPTLFVFGGGAVSPQLVKQTGEFFWVTDIRTGHPLYHKPISRRIVELSLQKGRIGGVGLSEYWGGAMFPYSTWTELMKAFPEAEFSDATSIVENARRIKSAAEIRCLEIATEIGEEVIAQVVKTGKPGVKEYLVRKAIIDALIDGGSELDTMVLISTGSDYMESQAHLNFVPTTGQRALQAGDIILTEFDTNYYGYRGQFNQPYAVVKASSEWRELANVCRESYERGVKALRAGVSVEELERAMMPPITEGGYKRGWPLFHSIDYSIAEPFSSFPEQPDKPTLNQFRLAANMVMQLEPHVVTPDRRKGMTLGSSLLVTEEGCRPLSRTWKPELKAIATD